MDWMHQGNILQSNHGTPLRWKGEASYIRFEFLLKNSEESLGEEAIDSVSVMGIGEAGIN